MNDQINTMHKPLSYWGGKWTDQKLNAFTKYVSAYLVIMSKNNYWKTIYFDGFAGSGTRIKKKNAEVLRLIQFDMNDNSIYKGAAERILTLQNNLSFDFHYFIDLQEESLEKLKNKLVNYQKNHKYTFQFRTGDCNTWIRELAGVMHKRPEEFASLILLDPFGMQINWDSIEMLRDTRSDVWILVPTGVIVNRLLNKNGELKHIKKLQSFFGLTENEIVDFFYQKENQNTLFGEIEKIEKIKDPIHKIAELYIRKLKTIWKFVTESPLILVNSKGCPIYHFVFASNNKNAVKIAKQIISKS